MITFETEKQEPVHLTFKDVEEDQFFIGNGGDLFQKSTDSEANSIAKSNGEPYCDTYCFYPFCPIKKILPRVIKISWD